MSTKIVFGALAMAMSAAAFQASASEYRYATFDFDGRDLAKHVDVSSLEGKQDFSAALYCQADVQVSGKASNVDCFNKQDLDAFQTQVESALVGMSYKPAQIHDQPVAVRISFRVVLNHSQDQTELALLPNLGSMQAEYGTQYIEPQERLDSTTWYEHYSHAKRVSGDRFLENNATLVRVVASVDASGQASDINSVEVDRAYHRHAKAISSGLKRAKFIPGFVQDKPVDMPYLAIVNFD